MFEYLVISMSSLFDLNKEFIVIPEKSELSTRYSTSPKKYGRERISDLMNDFFKLFVSL